MAVAAEDQRAFVVADDEAIVLASFGGDVGVIRGIAQHAAGGARFSSEDEVGGAEGEHHLINEDDLSQNSGTEPRLCVETGMMWPVGELCSN